MRPQVRSNGDGVSQGGGDAVRSTRFFLKASTAATLLASAPADLIASAAHAAAPSDGAWDTGMVRHLLPTVSDTRMLIKVSFRRRSTQRADTARWRHLRARPHERYARRILAFSREPI